KRRRRAKIMVYRKPYEMSNHRSRETRENAGFEGATQYYVKRPSERMPATYVEPSYVMPRNGHKPSKDDLDVSGTLDMFAGEQKRGDSYRSSELVWIPGNGNGKKLRAEANGNEAYY
ncbi:hypothetical protein, partial [Salmonella sp. s51933]|uniref:hypothetical protein n=1 Tax=Salmonella sp. s51933 TaxID=3160127 RepID=UPI003754174B